MSEILVTKRDGRIESFNVNKIKQMINWACGGLEVNPLALEAKFDEFLSDEVSTKSIQDNLIMSARMLANAADTDWTFVAGRLWTMNMWKERGSYDKSLLQFYNSQTLKGEYYGDLVENIVNVYSEDDFDYLGSKIVQKRDLDHSYGSVLTAYHKYLTKSECIQQMFMINSMIIASVSEEPVKFAEKVYEALSERKLSLASPWLGNLRQGGNISSCFIIQPDDSIDSIFDNIKNAALISKNGGGLGVSLARIRAEGSSVNGREDSSKGVFGWTRIFNDTALFVDQGGKRAGAFTISLPVWHRDIEGFLEIQSETGDVRTKAFDIFPQVSVYDYFMELDEKDGNNIWHTFCPHEVKQVLDIELYNLFGKEFKAAHKKCVKAYMKGDLKNVKEYKVRELIKHIMKAQFDSGLPYIAYIDTVNEDNPNKHEGVIPSLNLCVESFSVVKPDQYAHTCNLASVVVGRCKDLEEVKEIAKIATEILDNGIELTDNPIDISGSHNERFRTIGVGIQGLCDWFAKERTSYKDAKNAAHLMEAIQYGCVEKSIDLAKIRGRYPAFVGSSWDSGEQISKYKRHKNSQQDWEALEEDLAKYGIRNSQLTSPAPNTSTSIFMDAGAGVMPAYGGFYQKDNGTGMFPFASMYVKETPLFYAKNAPKYKMEELVDVVSELQVYTDAGISTEYFLDHNREDFSAKSLYDLIHYAWKKNTKALYYIRHIKKGKTFSDEVSISQAACEGCSG